MVDHHTAEPRLPSAAAVVNPNRLDETSRRGQLAAVGVTFLLVVALNRALRAAGWYGNGRAEPDLKQWLDLVALGTVCDVVPLTGVNRALVAQGLKVMARRGNPGLAALGDVAAADGDAHRLSRRLRPGPAHQCRRPGRHRPIWAHGCCRPTIRREAADLARRLDALNAERRALEQTVLDDAIARVGARGAATTAFC